MPTIPNSPAAINNLKTFSDRRTRRMRLSFLVPVLLVLLISACNLPITPQDAQAPDPTSAPANTAAPIEQPTAQPTNPPGSNAASVLPSDALEAVKYAIRAQPKAIPFRVDTTINSGKTPMLTTVEIETATRVMLVLNKRSVIWADGACFEKLGDGAWKTCASATSGQTAQTSAKNFLDGTIIEKGISMIQSAKFVGSETLNGVDVNIYEYTSSGDQYGVQVDATSRVWVDKSRGLPIKQETNSTAGGVSSTSTQLITYDPAIQVKAP